MQADRPETPTAAGAEQDWSLKATGVRQAGLLTALQRARCTGISCAGHLPLHVGVIAVMLSLASDAMPTSGTACCSFSSQSGLCCPLAQSEAGYLTPPTARRIQSLSGHEDAFQVTLVLPHLAQCVLRMAAAKCSVIKAVLWLQAAPNHQLVRSVRLVLVVTKTASTRSCDINVLLCLSAQVDSFNRALQRNTTAGKLTALFKTKMLSRSSLGAAASPAASTVSTAAKSPAASSGGGQGAAVSADELLQWSNVSKLLSPICSANNLNDVVWCALHGSVLLHQA